MFASLRIAARALRAVARKDAARDRLLQVFLLPWGVGTLALFVGTSWVPVWMWDAVGLGRHGFGSPEEILRVWALVGLLPLVWLGVRANVVAEGAQGAWVPLLRLPLSARSLLLAKAMRGLSLPLATSAVGLLLAVTASPFGEVDGAQTLAAAAGLGSFVVCTHALLFASALLGRHRLVAWALLLGVVAWIPDPTRLPGAELFRFPLNAQLSALGIQSVLAALAGLVAACLVGSADGGRLLRWGLGPLRSEDLRAAALVGLVALAPWAWRLPPRASVELAGASLKAEPPLRLEVELEPATPERSRALLRALSADLNWLAALGLKSGPLAVALTRLPEAGAARRRVLPALDGVLLEVDLSAEDDKPLADDSRALTALRELALRELLGDYRPWARGSARLLGAGLAGFRVRRPDEQRELLAAWALARLETSGLDPARWEQVEGALGKECAAQLATLSLIALEARQPGAVEDWARAAALEPTSASPSGLLELRALRAAWSERLSRLEVLTDLDLRPRAGGLSYRARLERAGEPLGLGQPLLVLLVDQRGVEYRGEALLGGPGFAERGPEGWAELTVPSGGITWRLGLRLPGLGCDLIWARGEAEVP